MINTSKENKTYDLVWFVDGKVKEVPFMNKSYALAKWLLNENKQLFSPGLLKVRPNGIFTVLNIKP